MTLPTTGAMSIAMINLELGRDANAPFSLDGAQERKLADREEGEAISLDDFYGKSSIVREPPEGEYYNMHSNPIYLWRLTHHDGGFVDFDIHWNSDYIEPVNDGYIDLVYEDVSLLSLEYFDYDGWRYHRGTLKEQTNNYFYVRKIYAIYRVKL